MPSHRSLPMDMDEIGNREADALLAHAAFVKGVARGILGRDPRVDDAVQETWLAAIRKRPDRAPGVRGWLAGAARNVALSFRRGDVSRRRREESSRSPTRLPTPAEIVAREEERRRVLHAVLSLDEPYRSAVLYRYYEELPPREIGRILGVPTETARTRVKRGLERLRQKLLEQHGGNGNSLCLALLPLAGIRNGTIAAATSAGAVTTGVVLMSAKTKLAVMAVLAALFLGGIGLHQFGGDAPSLPPDRPSGESVEVATRHREPVVGTAMPQGLDPTHDTAGSPGRDPDREDSDLAGTGPGDPSAAESRGVRTDRPGEVRGSVVSDEAGIPVEGARIILKYDFTASGGKWPKDGVRELTLVTDATGDFIYEEVVPGVYEIRVEHDDYAPRTLTGVGVGEGAGLEGLSVRMISDLRKLGSVAGIVLDLFGNPVVAARVVVHSSRDGGKVSAETDEVGGYLVERLLPGYYSVSLSLVPAEGEKERLWQRTLRARVLAGLTTQIDFEGSGTLTGVVLDADEEPIESATVVLEPVQRSERAAVRRAKTAEDGSFTIEDAGIGLYRVTVGGFSAGWFSVVAMEVNLGGFDQEIRIRLEAGEITGKLLLEDGKAPRSRGLHPNIMLFPAEWKGEPKDYHRVATAQPDPSGTYRFLGLAAGKYRLRIYQTGYRSLERDVEVSWGETVEDVDLKIKKLVVGTLEVKVVDLEGKPLAGVILNYGVKFKSGRGVSPTYPKPGLYVSSTVEVGSWDLSLIRPGLKPKHVPIVVNEGETTSVTVTMVPE